MLANKRGVDSNRQIESTIWCYASSVAYARRLCEPIKLYADDYARELLDFLPYNEIHSLEVPAEIPTDFWAAGKFFALQQMDLMDIHIDGDVFIKSPDLMDLINYELSINDLIVQSIENSWTYENEYYIKCIELLRKNNIVLPNDLADCTPAYNCGLVGFNNEELKQKYINHYLDSVKRVSANTSAMREIKSSNDIWLDLIIEQQHLYALSADYNVCNLLGTEEVEVYANARKWGYQHLLGSEKWENLDKIKRQLYNLDREIYNRVEKQLSKIL